MLHKWTDNKVRELIAVNVPAWKQQEIHPEIMLP